MSSTRGGFRVNAGRKPLSDKSPTVVVPLRMSEVERARLLRQGNSSWVRDVVDATPISKQAIEASPRGPTVVVTLRMTEAQQARYEKLGGAHWLRSVIRATPLPRKR